MNARRARALRREELPPDLKAEMHQRIEVIALARAARDDEARKAYRVAEQQAMIEKQRAFVRSEAEFLSAKREIVAELEARAAERDREPLAVA